MTTPVATPGGTTTDYRACEVRDYTLPAGPLTVEGGQNGGIRVEGWDRSEIRIQAVVSANAREEADAKRLVSEVQTCRPGAAGSLPPALPPATARTGR